MNLASKFCSHGNEKFQVNRHANRICLETMKFWLVLEWYGNWKHLSTAVFCEIIPRCPIFLYCFLVLPGPLEHFNKQKICKMGVFYTMKVTSLGYEHWLWVGHSLRQDLETGSPNLAIVQFWGSLYLKGSPLYPQIICIWLKGILLVFPIYL